MKKIVRYRKKCDTNNEHISDLYRAIQNPPPSMVLVFYNLSLLQATIIPTKKKPAERSRQHRCGKARILVKPFPAAQGSS